MYHTTTTSCGGRCSQQPRTSCGEDLRACLARTAVEAVVLVAMYVLALWLIDGKTFDASYLTVNVPKYAFLLVSANLLLKYVGYPQDVSAALSRGAAAAISVKFLTVLD